MALKTEYGLPTTSRFVSVTVKKCTNGKQNNKSSFITIQISLYCKIHFLMPILKQKITLVFLASGPDISAGAANLHKGVKVR
ncbi:hypothetical protein [Colwellia sp. MB02u-6]|uniref:hypothetical protein n=1 Tax=Colwellia sp. MB02u-6 TaxID=2759824 RepID=UPI00287049AF|nr:hypothetical protein [Colwellia sp. MB02u-6]